MAEQMGKNRARFKLREAAQAMGGRYIGTHEAELVGVVTDSRLVAEGNLYFALKGEKFNGHDFLREVALQDVGATVICDECYIYSPHIVVDDTLLALGDLARHHRRRFDIPVIGITGSYGKTSTRALLDAALGAKFNTLASGANFNNEIGVPMTLFQLDETHEAAIIEMGMRGRGQIAYLAGVAEPSVGVITNIGPQHIELLGSLEEIARAKAELVEALPADGLAVLPFDSPLFEMLRAKCPCRVVTFGAGEGADYRVVGVQVSPDGGVEFSIEFGIGAKSQPVTLAVPGVHNALNTSAAFAVAHQLGVEAGDIALALESAELPGARMRVVRTASGATLIDDCYNAGPDSTRAALQTLLDFPGAGRRVAILGDMLELGAFSEAEHRKIGAFAGQFVELLVGVGGETRPLLNAAIDAAREVENEMETHWFASAADARAAVRDMLQPADVVLVKGSRSVGLEAVVEELTQ